LAPAGDNGPLFNKAFGFAASRSQDEQKRQSDQPGENQLYQDDRNPGQGHISNRRTDNCSHEDQHIQYNHWIDEEGQPVKMGGISVVLRVSGPP